MGMQSSGTSRRVRRFRIRITLSRTPSSVRGSRQGIRDMATGACILVLLAVGTRRCSVARTHPRPDSGSETRDSAPQQGAQVGCRRSTRILRGRGDDCGRIAAADRLNLWSHNHSRKKQGEERDQGSISSGYYTLSSAALLERYRNIHYPRHLPGKLSELACGIPVCGPTTPMCRDSTHCCRSPRTRPGRHHRRYLASPNYAPIWRAHTTAILDVTTTQLTPAPGSPLL